MHIAKIKLFCEKRLQYW